jgi:hypothetical protein
MQNLNKNSNSNTQTNTQAIGAKMQTQNPYMTTTKINHITNSFIVPMKWSVLLFTNGEHQKMMDHRPELTLNAPFGFLSKKAKLTNRFKSLGMELVGTFCLYSGEFNVLDCNVDTDGFQVIVDAYLAKYAK